MPPVQHIADNMHLYTCNDIDSSIIDAAAHWELRVNKIRRDISVAGSPERCEFRFVIECSDDRLYVLESVTGSDIDQKTRIISVLDFLSRKEMPGINPHLRTKHNVGIVQSDSRFWRMAPFVHGIPLNRSEYLFEAWRGPAMARFLIALGDKSEGISEVIPISRFSITDYIHHLVMQIKKHDPEVLDRITPVIQFLEKRFMKIHDRLPAGFCHGDFHPLNIIWSQDAIQAVIDWEFLGIKPEAYDAANLVGCIGSENPHGLLGDLVTGFICHLKAAGIMSDITWEMFVELVIAIRFAWLSEWLRHKDQDMIAQESIYMKLLMNNDTMLKTAWGI